MTVPRLIAITLIFFVAAAAWGILGASLEIRTNSQDRELKEKVGGLWGDAQVQRPPTFERAVADKGKPAKGTGAKTHFHRLELAASDIHTAFQLDQRRKGLLWYATYKVDFDATYKVDNDTNAPADTSMRFTFPNPEGVYDGFVVLVDGKEVPVGYGAGQAAARFTIPARSSADVAVKYRSQGLDSWTYAPTEGVEAVKDFTLTMKTDFADVDFPDGAVSPTSKERAPEGWELVWHYDSVVSGRPMALVMPQPLNPGPVAARISLFAPVSLLFFFAALVLNQATAKVRIHPMNYAFLAAGFFAFHLLFAYLIDRVDINVAFAAAAATSVALCVGYLRVVVGDNRTLIESAVGQFVFLVLFSYSFFFAGSTGLAITIGAIVTLGYYMAKTGRVDWEEVFGRRQAVKPEAPRV